MSEPVFLNALTLVMGTVAFVASLSVFRRYLEMRHDRRPPVAVEGIEARLARIEAAVESTAIEVERISEGNRFVAKLLADRAGVASLPVPAERVLTPH